ncbi:MAG: SDR family oxidoreductase [Sedimentisphaerales bacterium]|nr:SDR family oxidoreductase [Sedimentisphaerales bacterium]
MAKRKARRPDAALADLIKISNLTGRDPRLVVGGGGNTSVKTTDGRYMYVKASGTALKDMDAGRGWRRLKLNEVLAILDDAALAALETNARETEIVRRLLAACADDMPASSRPSVESSLHAMLGRHVIHLHPTAIGSYVNAKQGRQQLEKIFAKESYPPLWVPYADPGFTLARRIQRLLATYRKQYGRHPSIMILEKHGLFVTAETADAAVRLVRRVIGRCRKPLLEPKVPPAGPVSAEDIIAAQLAIRGALQAATGQYLPVRHYLNNTVAAFQARPDAAALLEAGPLAPDEMVYANGPPVFAPDAGKQTLERVIQRRLAKALKAPAAFVVRPLGLFVATEPGQMETVRDLAYGSMYIRSQAARFGGVKALNRREQDFINIWEAESYRRQLAAGAAAGSLKDRIAVVTGAASGLGRSIAVGLARCGMMVALADVDASAAAETAGLIGRDHPRAALLVLPCDVTSEASARQAYRRLLNEWGGLDVLVNAAGVAPAGPLTDLPVDRWRKALEINLTGYFLMAQQAARILIDQGIGGSIINLSSKSGLEASRENTPYNATKAGEIHMARGWAMELGEHGIRVNSVCPGNVFEGSKIWNPQYIRSCAKKYGIQPDEVIPYYVNKTILKRQIKGQDIADAIVFLCSDQARTITGQTLVVDGGQVMVR